MTKKEYLLAVINAVPDWEMGQNIKILVEEDKLDSTAINQLVIIFKKVVDQFLTEIKEGRHEEINKVNEFINGFSQLFDNKSENEINSLASFYMNMINNKHLQVFVSSTYSDLKEQKEKD